MVRPGYTVALRPGCGRYRCHNGDPAGPRTERRPLPVELESNGLKALYRNRFDKESEQRQETWEVLCEQFFQKWVDEDAVVLDLAAGHCEFINNIGPAAIAVDLNPDVKLRAATGVETHVLRSDDLVDIAEQSIDVVFISNFFEHVSREVILATLVEVRRVLRAGRPAAGAATQRPLLRRDYWQFFDHITPVDDRALVEAFSATGFDVVKNIPRFLPYTTKSLLPSWPILVKLYLRVPLAWRVMGAQAFLVATPTRR